MIAFLRKKFKWHSRKSVLLDISKNMEKQQKEIAIILKQQEEIFKQNKEIIQLYSNMKNKATSHQKDYKPSEQDDRNDKIRIIYAADNRNRLNWGCRATSAALSMILRKNYNIVHTITGKYTLGKGTKISFDWDNRKEKDFVTCSAEESVQKLLAAIPYNPQLEELNLLNHHFDILVINGEGTMIMSDPPRRDTLIYLMLVWWAHSLGKRVYFVNAIFSDCARTGRNEKTVQLCNSILGTCDLLAVRDKISLKYVNDNMKGCNAVWVPDALFIWKKWMDRTEFDFKNTRYIMPFGNENDNQLNGFDLTMPYICVGGGSLAAKDQEKAKKTYIHFLNELKSRTDMQVCVVATCCRDSYLEEACYETQTHFIPADIPILSGAFLLANAQVFISGRYHPAILASLGGTPCIFFSSNSHKTLSLQYTLEYETVKEFNAFPSADEFEDIFSLMDKKISSGLEERMRILNIVDELAEKAEQIFT